MNIPSYSKESGTFPLCYICHQSTWIYWIALRAYWCKLRKFCGCHKWECTAFGLVFMLFSLLLYTNQERTWKGVCICGSMVSPGRTQGWGSLVFWVKTSGQQGLQMHHIPPFHLFYLPLCGNPAAYPRLCRRSSSPSFRPFLLSPDTILLVPVSSPKRDPVEENGCK